jgi:predicted transglutaminase-like cysteine proteinase
MNKRFGLSLAALACAAVLAAVEPAAATMQPYTSAREQPVTAHYGTDDALFGMEIAPTFGEVSSKWLAVETKIEQEKAVLADCRASEDCPAPARELLRIVAEGAGRTGLARVGLINRAVNLAITPTSDEAQWGVDDRWSPPLETLQTHRGDCEDYAIVKYAALLEAGFSRDDMKIVILRNFIRNEDHAVLAARVDGEWLILDDRNLTLVPDTEMPGAHPLFALDHDGAHRLVAPQRANQASEALTPPPPRRSVAAAKRDPARPADRAKM